MQVVEVDVPVRLDPVAEHVLVVAPHEDVGEVLLDVLARDDLVVAGFVEELDPVLEAVVVDRHGVPGHERRKGLAALGWNRQRMAPWGSTPISSAQ